jgi:TolB-like protein/class 3 adenylate cyclase/TolA-binding protein
MTTERVKRKISAIFSADVEGYSRLMGEDEELTVRTLTAYREIMASLIQQYRGRVIDSPGDNLLAEFSSVVDAVQCGVEIQQVLKARNAGLPENRRMQFRIGVNLGDVIEEGERIYGDGVNIAARVEGLAEKGSICISGSAYEQIKNKLALGYEYLGEHKVKNIAEPVRVYKAQIEPVAKRAEKRAGLRGWQWAALAVVAFLILGAGAVAIWHFLLRSAPPPVEVASVEKMAFKLPDKPSIAVLPFVNMSEDPKQEYFSDGMTEDLITDLSKISGLFVIGRNSTFTYKGKTVKTRQVAEELGVRYVLEGSVRRAGEKVRINAQLIDATTGHHLWAERYDGRIGDVFALQDKITQKIVAALAVKLTGGEQEQVARKETDNIAAYDAFLQGWEYYRRRTPDDWAKAASYFNEAIELDLNYSRAHAALGSLYFWSTRYRWSSSLGLATHEVYKLASKHTQKALNNPTSLGHWLASQMSLRFHEHEKAISEAERAIALDPNDPSNHVQMAYALIFAGRPKEAVDFIKRAMRLDPHYPAYYLYVLGLSHFAMGQLEEAVTLFERVHRRNPEVRRWAAPLAATYAHLGRDQEARAVLDKYGYTLLGGQWYYWPFKDPAVADRFTEGLRKAGLK